MNKYFKIESKSGFKPFFVQYFEQQDVPSMVTLKDNLITPLIYVEVKNETE